MADDPLDALTIPQLDDPPPAPAPGTKRRPGRPRGSKNKPKGDAAPRTVTRARVPKVLTDAELRAALEEALIFPAIPAMIAYPTVEGKMYLANHFTITGPWTADQLMRLSKMSPGLRRILEGVAKGSSAGMALKIAAVYLGGPAMFILGQKGIAETLTMSTQSDESQMAKLMESMLSSAGGFPFAAEPETNGASPPDASTPAAEASEQPQPPPDEAQPLA